MAGRVDDRNPSFTSALQVADFFGVPADRLARADFGDLLEHELADAERYRKVEGTIERLKREWEGKPEKVVLIEKRRRRKKEGR